MHGQVCACNNVHNVGADVLSHNYSYPYCSISINFTQVCVDNVWSVKQRERDLLL